MSDESNTCSADNSTQVKLRLREDVLAWFDAEAKILDRSRNWVIHHALRDRMKRVDAARARSAGSRSD